MRKEHPFYDIAYKKSFSIRLIFCPEGGGGAELRIRIEF